MADFSPSPSLHFLISPFLFFKNGNATLPHFQVKNLEKKEII
jgi:hypothetical protein